MADDIIFAKDPVWSQTTRSGFRQQLFVMYHSTDARNVESILSEGFKVSEMKSHLVLGSGLYVSRDLDKAAPYGPVTFKLLVYPGKTKSMIDEDDPLKTSWQQEFSSAWIPPNIPNIHHPSLPHHKEETCVKSSAQVRILGLVRGWDKIDPQLRRRIKNSAGTFDRLDRQDNVALEHMLEELGIVYSSLVNLTRNTFLEGSRYGEIWLSDWTGEEEQQWSRTWDNCLENKATGMVLTLGDEHGEGNGLSLTPVNMQIDRRQKWRLDGKGRFVHKSSSQVMLSDEPLDPNGERTSVKVRPLRTVGRCEFWKFRCLYEIREKDDFVNYTPWHNMISWD